jgi:hypothetical protein
MFKFMTSFTVPDVAAHSSTEADIDDETEQHLTLRFVTTLALLDIAALSSCQNLWLTRSSTHIQVYDVINSV